MKSQIVGLKALCGLKGIIRKRALLAVCEMDSTPWLASSRVGLGNGVVLSVTRADADRLQIRRVNIKCDRDRRLDALEMTASAAVAWTWRVRNGATNRPDLGVRGGGVLEIRGA
ncbi:MAG: hypothetical protein WCO91_12260 [Gemmataceae bacterium]